MPLCYVDHHDNAYKWAKRRRIERHLKTGAAQLVEVRERIEEVPVLKPVEVLEPRPSLPLLFVDTPNEELLGYGVPAEWLNDVRTATEDNLLNLIGYLPQEAGWHLRQAAG